MLGKNKEPKLDHEKLGKAVEQLFLTDYIEFLGSTRRQIKGAFIRGIFTGFGGVIGATVFVALLLTLLHFLGGAPFIGHYVQSISDSITAQKH